MQINERVIQINDKEIRQSARFVLYWMQMFKRAESNHALTWAIKMANELRLPLVVYEGLKYYYPWANDRIHTFILQGVNETRKALESRGIRYVFYLQRDETSPRNTIAELAKDAALVVTDDFPCFIIPEHNCRVAMRSDVAVHIVDSCGIIPMSKFPNEEYAAFTIRPKIARLLPHYLKQYNDEEVRIESLGLELDCPQTHFDDSQIPDLVASCRIDHSVKPSPLYRGGRRAGSERLSKFIREILPGYAETRNKPEIDGSSRLSAYLHFGFISPLEIALAVSLSDAPKQSREAYLEELIVRRELSFNMTRHNPHYDSLRALPPWAQLTMREHLADAREFGYSLEELESAATGDELWNAAQREMLHTGEMHNYVRMLWGKNVIAWSQTYEEAFERLVHLNNKYCLDGRDPNSYAGILWCFGKHDRPWPERQVFGKIRCMKSSSTGRKFNKKKYIEWTLKLAKPLLDVEQ